MAKPVLIGQVLQLWYQSGGSPFNTLNFITVSLAGWAPYYIGLFQVWLSKEQAFEILGRTMLIEASGLVDILFSV